MVVSSFDCPHCHYKNNQLDPASEIKTQGVRMSLNIATREDLDRYVITTDYTSVQVLELDFEIPPMSQRSQVTTVEGILSKTIANLNEQKNVLKQTHSELAVKMEVVIKGLMGILTLSEPLPMVIFIIIIFKLNYSLFVIRAVSGGNYVFLTEISSAVVC